MKNFLGILCFVLLLLPALCQAQLNGMDLSAVEATTPLTPDQLPPFGTFYSASNPQNPPIPSNIYGWNAWFLSNGNYLLDDLDGLSTDSFQAMDDSALNPPGSYGSGGYEFTNSVAPFVFPTNGLWLWITNVADATVYANLNGATDYVYEIFSTTNLAAVPAVTNWNIETEVFPGTNTNTMPFTVPTADRNPLFLWARDWTGITSNGNETPNWWFWLYFGTTELLDSDLDGQGNTLLYDFQNGIDPNIIQFSIVATNNYVARSSAPLQLSVSQGSPFNIAIVIDDDTNYMADAEWQPYTGSNITVNVGTTQGWHSVWIGLRGFSSNSTQTWKCKRLELDSIPPVLVITNPAVTTTSVPMIQIYGYCPTYLTSMSYDVSNALGVVTNLDTAITDQFYDTNICEITTNSFQCMDVPLTNGLNIITIHAIDMAGNTSQTNVSITLDYTGATNPVVQLTWPQNGMQICQGSFTLRGWTGDPSSAVLAQIVDTNGNTNVVSGEVERTGVLWAKNLPLAEGTNFLTLWVTNAAGLWSMTNITVVKNDMTLVLTNESGDLWLPAVDVSGLISDPTATVWVNGVQGINNGDGTWNATSVPVAQGGVASFDMVANSSSGDPDASTNEDKPTEIVRDSLISTVTLNSTAPTDTGTMGQWRSFYSYSYGGTSSGDFHYTSQNPTSGNYFADFSYTFEPCPGDNCGQGTFTENVDGDTSTETGGGINFTWPVGYAYSEFQSTEDRAQEHFTSRAIYKLHVGGKSGDKYVGEVSASLIAYNPDYDTYNSQVGGIPSTEITASEFGSLDASGNAYKLVSGGETHIVTPRANGSDNNDVSGTYPGLNQLTHLTACTAVGNPDNTRTTIGIGEVVKLDGMPAGTRWSTSGGTLSSTNGGSTVFTASQSPGGATVNATIDNVQIPPLTFEVKAPDNVLVYSHVDNPPGVQNSAGTQMGAETDYVDVFLPPTVSFANAQFREFGDNPSSLTVTVPWPSGTNTTKTFQLRASFGGACDNEFFGPDIAFSGLDPTSYLLHGGSYTGTSFTATWYLQYLNASGVWTSFHTMTATFTYGSDKTCTVKYLGQPGNPQGPY